MTFEHICEGTKCEHYIVWDFGWEDCYSCGLIGQSYHVTKYPDNCQFIKEIKKHEQDETKSTTDQRKG